MNEYVNEYVNEQKQESINNILEAYKNDNIVECLELIDKYRLDFEDEKENFEGTHSKTDINLIIELINTNKVDALNFVFWFIDYASKIMCEDSNKIYMFYAFSTAVLEGNILLAERFIQTFKNNIHPDFLYDRKFVNEIIDVFADNEEEFNNINVLLFVLNTIYDNEYITRFHHMPYNMNFINETRNMLENKIREHI